MKKKILFLYNGGTIGQIPRLEKVNGVEQTVLYPPVDGKEFQQVCEKIIANVKETVDMDITFELVTTKDSSNMSPEDWTVLAHRIEKAQDDESYDASEDFNLEDTDEKQGVETHKDK